jgi:hypothetical protein
MSTLEEDLREQTDAANNAFHKLQRKYNEAVREAKHEAEKNIEMFFNTIYRADLLRLGREAIDIQDALIAETERVALEGNESPWPLGTKVTKEESIGHAYLRNKRTVFGIFEVVTRESVFADNLADYSRPSVGTVIVRYLNKDGSPLKKIARHTYDWKPVDPTVLPNPNYKKPIFAF